MSVPLIELDEKIVTDTGQIVHRHKGLVRKIQAGQSLDNLLVVENSDVYRMIDSGTLLKVWTPGEVEGPPEETLKWNIPQEYLDLDWEQYVIELYSEREFPDSYMDRLLLEIDLVKERQMEEFFRTIIYVMEQIRNANLPVGVGRGSSCASFLLYLIGVHRVDCVKYEIPEGEFFK